VNWSRLLWSSLWQARWANLNVILGVALGTAVLTGALLMGDSLQASLRDQTLNRLGRIDLALVSERFFPGDLSQRLTARAARSPQLAAPVILLRGSVLHRTAGGGIRRVGKVQVVGVDESFWPLFDLPPRSLQGQVAINATLASDLGIGRGDFIELRLEQPQTVPADSILGRRTGVEGLLLPQTPVAEILPLEGAGRFSLAAEQAEPRLLYVHLATLQRRLREEGLQPTGFVNTLLLATGQPDAVDEAAWQQQLHTVVRLEDLGLELRPDVSGQRYLSLSSRRMLIEPEITNLVQQVAVKQGWQCQPTLTYLANLTVNRRDYVPGLAAGLGRLATPATLLDLTELAAAASHYTPYAAVTALDPTLPPPWGPFLDGRGQPLQALGEDEILLTEPMARDLWPRGDWARDLGKPLVSMAYFIEGPAQELREATHHFKLAGVLPLQGPALDRSLTPGFPGLTGQSIRDWKPPFPRALWHPEWVRDKDERYYRRNKVAPQAFVSPATGRKLWRSRYGSETSLRLAAPPLPLAELEAQVRTHLQPVLRAEQMGLTMTAVRARLLAATRSGTALMFGWLFVGFSFFLILAAALLVGLFVRLRLEQRQAELGLFYALGFPNRQVQRLLVREGLVLAALGGVLGTGVALGYAWLLVHALRWGWAGALPNSFLEFHWRTWETPWGRLPTPSLLLGWFISLGVAWGTIRLALRGWERLAPQRLLGGGLTALPTLKTRRRAWLLAAALATGGALLAGTSRMVPPAHAPGLFFGAGFLILAAGLAAVRARLQGQAQHHAPISRLVDLATSQMARQPRRGLLTAGLIASGVFMVLAVEAFRKTPAAASARDSGTGGFAFIAEADVPLPWTPTDPASWSRLATDAMQASDPPPAWPAGTRLIGFRLRPGDDVSCLNLYAPRQPRLLGVPTEMAQRGGFTFILPADATPDERANPWTLLDRPASPAIPLFADDHTAQWILQKSIGDEWELIDETGAPFKVRLVGMLQSSIFQSELLLSARHFQRLFPSRAGFGFFLIDAPPGEAVMVRQTLEGFLGESFGFHVTSAAERLASFQAVENTYLSTFQALGGIGLLLGVVGLAIVLLRNFQERLGEWALLQALGYARRDLGWLALVEQGMLLMLGMSVGLVSAVVAVGPLWATQAGQLPWRQMLLLAVLLPLVGGLAGMAALWSVLRVPLLAALRR